MSQSYVVTESATFTITHARELASKVATDLKRMQRFYNQPADAFINQLEQEVVLLLKAGYLGTVTYGFKRGDQFIQPSLRYTARDLAGDSAANDDPGAVKPGADVSGASFYSYLTYSSSWDALSDGERETFKNTSPITRTGAPEPTVKGYMVADKSYSSGSRVLNRSSIRSV